MHEDNLLWEDSNKRKIGVFRKQNFGSTMYLNDLFPERPFGDVLIGEGSTQKNKKLRFGFSFGQAFLILLGSTPARLVTCHQS